MNNTALREKFPILKKASKEAAPLAYLDNAATTQKPTAVIDAICEFYTTYNANVHRGLYGAAEKATTHYEAARNAVKQFINAQSNTEIVFTKGTTEAINLIASSWGKKNLLPHDVLLLSQVEHHANLLPWLELAREKNLEIRYIPYDQTTKKLSLENINLTGVKLLAVQHTSNVLGNVWDNDFSNLFTLITKIHEIGGTVLLDVAQSIAHYPIDVQKLKADFLAFSGHKLYGPTGVGVLYVKSSHHKELVPYQVGGSMISHVSYERASWAAMPHLLEAGTPPIAGVIGLHAAINFINTNISFPALAQHETALCKALITGLNTLPGIHIVTDTGDSTNAHQHIVSFYHDTIHAHDIASCLGEKNIAVRAGNHCVQPLIALLKIPALVRISVGAYTTLHDITLVLQALAEAINLLR
ncbi:cysteine desulfurase [Candidatus Dependentiae bacterium]|nr:cysteine desulfurase [Candidatus Dependentiae bacterium]